MTTKQATTPDPTRAYIYCRVSSDEQRKKGYGLDLQEADCREYAARLGLFVAGIYKDDYPGTTLERPALGEMLRALARGGVGTVVVWHADRISRDPEGVDYLVFLRNMKRQGVRVFIRGKGEVRLELGFGNITNHVSAMEGGEDNKKRTERTAGGRAAKASKGKWVGNGNAPFGYVAHGKREEKYLSIHGENAATVRKIFDWYIGAGGQQPLNLVQIAARLMAEHIPPPGKYSVCGTWHAKVVRALLDRRAYIGEFEFTSSYVPGLDGKPPLAITISLPELAIVDRATFERAQRQRQQNKARATRNATRHYLLTGHFRCACGAGMQAYHASNGHNYYGCVYKRAERHLRRCNNKQVAAAKVEPVLWAWLRELLKDEAALETGIDRMIERSELELTGKRERLEAVKDLMGEIDADLNAMGADLRALKTEAGRGVVRRQIDDLGARRENLEAERAELEADLGQAQVSEADRQIIRGVARDLRGGLDDADFETMRYILGRLNVKATYRVDDSGEWLDARCEFLGENEPSIELPVSRSGEC